VTFRGAAKGHAALLAFLDIVFWFLEFIGDVFEGAVFRKVPDWINGFENRLQTGVLALGVRDIHLQKLNVGGLLHLDQVRHRNGGGKTAEILANALAARIGLIHEITSRPGGLCCPALVQPPSSGWAG